MNQKVRTCKLNKACERKCFERYKFRTLHRTFEYRIQKRAGNNNVCKIHRSMLSDVIHFNRSTAWASQFVAKLDFTGD